MNAVGLPAETFPDTRDKSAVDAIVEKFDAHLHSVTYPDGRTIQTVIPPSSAYAVAVEHIWPLLSRDVREKLLQKCGAPLDEYPDLPDFDFSDYKARSQFKIFQELQKVIAVYECTAVIVL